MATASTRSKVLSVYKALQRTRERVFVEDEPALNYVRKKIKEEFVKHKDVTDPTELSELLKVANESEVMLRTKVVQAKEVRPNVFRLNSEHIQTKCTDVMETCANCTCGRGG